MYTSLSLETESKSIGLIKHHKKHPELSKHKKQIILRTPTPLDKKL